MTNRIRQLRRQLMIVLREQNPAAQAVGTRRPPPRKNDAPRYSPTPARTQSAPNRRQETSRTPSAAPCHPACPTTGSQPFWYSPANPAAAAQTNRETIPTAIARKQPPGKNPLHSRQAKLPSQLIQFRPQQRPNEELVRQRKLKSFQPARHTCPSIAPFSRGESCIDHNIPGANRMLATGAPTSRQPRDSPGPSHDAQNTVSPGT